MNSDGFSTAMDAVLFLAMVAVSALILSPVITGHMTEHAMADRGLRETSADVLISLETEKVDFFEYRVLGDIADSIAGFGGVNATNDILYRDVTKALLGRGNRHRTVMDIAAGDAACQFRLMDTRLNPVTGEYDSAVSMLIDQSVRTKLDSRYGYEFTLRWSPVAGVPFGGEVKAGRPHPAGAASSSMPITIPFTTNITTAFLESANAHDLYMVDRAIVNFTADKDDIQLRQETRNAIARCLRNTTGMIIEEIWANTLGQSISANRLNPEAVLKRFSGNETLNRQALLAVNNTARSVISDLAIANSREDLDLLSDTIAEGVAEGSMSSGSARKMIVAWLKSRYEPSGAVATVSIWVESYAPA